MTHDHEKIIPQGDGSVLIAMTAAEHAAWCADPEQLPERFKRAGIDPSKLPADVQMDVGRIVGGAIRRARQDEATPPD